MEFVSRSAVNREGMTFHAMSQDLEMLEWFCFHEAGHAAVAWHYGARLAEIFVSDADGYCRHKELIDFPLDPEVMRPEECWATERVAQILLAGEMADKQFFPNSDLLDYESSSDRKETRFLASKLFPDSPEEASAWVEARERETVRLVAELRLAIETLAYELADAKDGKLSGEKAKRILDDTLQKS